MPTAEQSKVFTRRVRVSGQLMSNFVFESDSQVKVWQKIELPKLEQQFGKLQVQVSELPGFKIGDTCRVIGEGDDTFVIQKLLQYDKNRFGFVLDSGWTEEVAKCY